MTIIDDGIDSCGDRWGYCDEHKKHFPLYEGCSICKSWGLTEKILFWIVCGIVLLFIVAMTIGFISIMINGWTG